MDEQERKEHFKGSAKLLWSKLQQAQHDLVQEPEQIIAEYAYDLVYHTLDHADLDQDFYGRDEFEYDTHKIVKSIPDITAWPPTE